MFFTVTVKTRDTVKTSGTQMLDNSEELTDHHKVEEDQRRIEVWEGERGGGKGQMRGGVVYGLEKYSWACFPSCRPAR